MRLITSLTRYSSGSTEIKHCLRKYSLGFFDKGTSAKGPCSLALSSRRESNQGSQAQLPSKKATLKLGNFSNTPPAQKLETARINSTGLRSAIATMFALGWSKNLFAT